jgi:large subunit ribosomal protein L23
MNKMPGDVIKRPLLTEKGTALSEENNVVLFEVAKTANKIEIRQAIEQLYDVRVLGVNTQIVRGKRKAVGRSVGFRPSWKKAVVRLAEGADIDFFAS